MASSRSASADLEERVEKKFQSRDEEIQVRSDEIENERVMFGWKK